VMKRVYHLVMDVLINIASCGNVGGRDTAKIRSDLPQAFAQSRGPPTHAITDT
jgi:hypothetical protein